MVGLTDKLYPSARLLKGRLESGYIELLHLEHGPHHSLRSWRVLILQQLGQNGRNDLPGDAVLVFQPATLDLFSALFELLPIIVHFLLAGAVYNEGYGVRKAVVRTAVQGDVLLSFDFKGHGHYAAAGTRTCV